MADHQSESKFNKANISMTALQQYKRKFEQ
jgi:hypothetical protein